MYIIVNYILLNSILNHMSVRVTYVIIVKIFRQYHFSVFTIKMARSSHDVFVSDANSGKFKIIQCAIMIVSWN